MKDEPEQQTLFDDNSEQFLFQPRNTDSRLMGAMRRVEKVRQAPRKNAQLTYKCELIAIKYFITDIESTYDF